MKSQHIATIWIAPVVAVALVHTTHVKAQVWINELFVDPGTGHNGENNDFTHEYIELRGTPNFNLNNHYLIFVENEAGSSGTLGQIEHIFNLNGRTIGSNGFLVLRQKDNPYTSIAPGTANLVNTGSSVGYGSGSGSSIGATDQNGEGVTENSGASVFLIRRDNPTIFNVPRIGTDIDGGDNGKDLPNLVQDWAILDQIGYVGIPDQRTFRIYSNLGFGSVTPTPEDPINPDIEPGAVFVDTGQDSANPADPGFNEVEYLARWGSSSDNVPSSWWAGNLSNKVEAGYVIGDDHTWAVSGVHDSEGGTPATRDPEAQRGYTPNAIPYGTHITNTLGRPNYPIPDGDLSQNEAVDQADLNIVVSNWQVNNPSLLGYWLGGDPSGDGLVSKPDLDFVMDKWPAFGGPGFTTPDFGILTADANLDGRVNTLDFNILAGNFGQPLRGYAAGDFNYDHTVSSTDFGIFAARYGQGFAVPAGTPAAVLGSAAVPEPASLSLLGFGLIGLKRRRRI